MTKIDKISIAITREQHAKIKAAVGRGDYASTSEVIRTALREWEMKEEMRRLEGKRIARQWDEGIGSGPASRDGAPAHRVCGARENEERQEATAQGRMTERLSPRAEADLEEIGDYIVGDSPRMPAGSSNVCNRSSKLSAATR